RNREKDPPSIRYAVVSTSAGENLKQRLLSGAVRHEVARKADLAGIKQRLDLLTPVVARRLARHVLNRRFHGRARDVSDIRDGGPPFRGGAIAVLNQGVYCGNRNRCGGHELSLLTDLGTRKQRR